MAAVARVGDLEITHCSGMTRAEGSPNVFCNGIPVSRVGDYNTVHMMPGGDPCTPHSVPAITGSSSVFVNGKPLLRVGDQTCTLVAQGSPNVFAGG